MFTMLKTNILMYVVFAMTSCTPIAGSHSSMDSVLQRNNQYSPPLVNERRLNIASPACSVDFSVLMTTPAGVPGTNPPNGVELSVKSLW